MNQPTLPPLAAGYLDELGRLLHGIDPVERVEVLDGVREHLAASLEGTAGTDADVRAALAELGSPQSVADEAYADRPRPAVQPVIQPGFQQPVPLTPRAWEPSVVAILDFVALAAVLLTTSSGAVVQQSSSSSSAAGQADTMVTTTTFSGSIGSGVVGLLTSLPFVLILIVVLMMSPLWTAREKTVLVALAPAVAVAFGVLPEVGWAVFGEYGVYGAAYLALILTVGGGMGTLWVLVRRGAHRANPAGH